MLQSSKYPHPQEQSWPEHQKAVIRDLTKRIQQLDAQRFLDLRQYARENEDDLDGIQDKAQETLDNLIAAMEDTDSLADEHSPATAAAMSIERMAYAEWLATIS